VFYHIWAFVAAGLYPNEKKLVHVYLPFSLALFLGGVVICQFAVMPRAVEAMLWFNEWLDLDATLRLEEWLSFALLMPVVFGLSFQTPLVMMFAHKIGVITVDMYREKRRIAWFSMSIFAALITPSVDPVSMLFLWVPMGCLYELGILLCVYQGGEDQGLAEWELEDQRKGELVEV
jgi:sec-independent protein translocase protein TatC